jgi:hypothetical protein
MRKFRDLKTVGLGVQLKETERRIDQIVLDKILPTHIISVAAQKMQQRTRRRRQIYQISVRCSISQ